MGGGEAWLHSSKAGDNMQIIFLFLTDNLLYVSKIVFGSRCNEITNILLNEIYFVFQQKNIQDISHQYLLSKKMIIFPRLL